MKNKKVIVGIIILIAVSVGLWSYTLMQKNPQPTTHDSQPEVTYYTCGMHPSVRVSPEEHNQGKVNCPICNMKLTPVYKEEAQAEDVYYGCGMEGTEHVFQIKGIKPGMTCPICGMPLKELSKEEADELKGVISRVKIKGEQVRLAGVETEPIKKLHLYKKIRTVGKVAYDPQLAVAQEEFISALNTLNKIQEGNIPEIKERAEKLVESSKRKLRLFGLSNEQIEELREVKDIQTSLILPEEKMWIYGDVYEYELNWVKVGGKVNVVTQSLPGEIFEGVIASVNPVLDPGTRSVKFRAEIKNPELKLKPEMYVDVIIKSMYTSADGRDMVLAISRHAVLDTGTRKIVWIDKGNGEYEGRSIEVGPESTAIIDGKELRFYPVLKGVKEGELVVTKANFLIDSQSQITGIAAFSYSGTIGAEEGEGAAPPPSHQH